MIEDLWIDGGARPGAAGDRFDVIDPATETTIASVADGSPDDALAACEAAAGAQPGWAAPPPRQRAEILRSCWQTLVDHTDELASLIVREHGKPFADARGEVAYGAEFFRWNAEETVRIRGEIATAPSGANRMIVHHPPVGVVAMITPWNFPAAMITRKLAPALGAGNAVVIKPAPDTPLTALRIAGLLGEAGVPPGVVNVVPTTRAAEWFEAVVDHRAVRMLSFTGSTAVGRTLLRRSADRVLKTVMELGGNAPFVVFDDADLDRAVEGAMVAKMRHSAETCTAANRFYVEAGVAEEFTERLTAAMASVRVGNGFDEGVNCGPMINRGAVGSMDALVRSAVMDGARVRLGGEPSPGPGFFYPPTVLSDVRHGSSITTSEIFGPIAPVITFDDHERMITMANDTEMGLTGYVYTRDLAKGLRVAERLQAGMVGVNRGAVSDPAAPFGGMKQSGLGREGSTEGIYEFCETQYIATDW
ncbi:MAG: NAD-dependent succinate-semialdehyde dehydrogenase [Ilumatobacteraceae bacterium]